MKGGNTLYLIFSLLFAGASVLAPDFAFAAKLYVSPSVGAYDVGGGFSTTIRVNSEGIAINAAEGVLTFNPEVLQVVSISKAGTIFNVDVEDPEFSNADGTVRWAGVVLNPGYTGPSGNLLTVNFRAVAPGTGTTLFDSSAVFANDGRGTNVLNGTSGGVYTIGGASGSPTPTPDSTVATRSSNIEWFGDGDAIGLRIACILILLAVLLAIWLLLAVWRRRRAAVVLVSTKDEKKVADRLEHITRDMEDEIALLGGIAKNRPLYPEEKYLRSKLLQYSRAMKVVLSDTHRRLAKKK